MDAAGDASPGGFQPRLLAKAFFTMDTNYASSTGMGVHAFEIATTGAVDGDLLLLIGNVTGGNSTVWQLPLGFEPLVEQTINNFEQSYVVAWKLADHEPAKLSGGYVVGISNGDSALALVAISGADPLHPIADSLGQNGGSAFVPAPVTATSTGVTTTAPGSLLVWAAGMEWDGHQYNYVGTYTPPDGFTSLTAFGDHGDLGFDESVLSIAYRTQPVAGPTGTISGTLGATVAIHGIPWAATVAITPASP